jgi:transcriptional antiterminator NusG
MESNDLSEDEKSAESESNDQPESEKVDDEKPETSEDEKKEEVQEPEGTEPEAKPDESLDSTPVNDQGEDSTEPAEDVPDSETSETESVTPEPESDEPDQTEPVPEEEPMENEPVDVEEQPVEEEKIQAEPSEEEPVVSEPSEPKPEQVDDEEEPFFEKGIFAIKTSIGHEKMVADTLEGRVRRRKADVYSIMLPPNLRGYLLIEALDNREALRDLIKGVQHARTLVEGTTSIEEIEGFLTPKPIVSGIEEGDIVEVIAGPFKGEKAKVKQIDISKEEITIELFEAMVSIPVTIRGDHVRVLEKESS